MPSLDSQLALGREQHAVQFYGVDDELAGSVASYLGAGLAAEEPVLIVATAPHRVAFGTGLAGLGFDVGAAKARGRLVVLDAAGTIGSLLTDDKLDPDRFGSVIGGLLREVAVPGKPVRIYAEMVALLWDAGRVNDALELERMWNDLGLRLPFSLLCGYSARLLADRDEADAVAEVRSLHTCVVGSQPFLNEPAAPAAAGAAARSGEAVRSFPAVRASAREARHFVLGTLRSWGQLGLADDAAIVTAELAANAVLHARSSFTVAVSQAAGGLRIEVRDASPMLSADGGPPLAVREGHGLAVVAKVARRWAVNAAPGGKVVWAELPPPAP